MCDSEEVRNLKAQLAELEALHGGELGLPKEGWPEYHKRKMETLRDLTAGHYQRKLAERDALLRDVSKKNDLACDRAYRNGLKKGFGYGINGEEDRYNSVMESYHRSIAQALAEDALSASAEPSAPVERDERAAFESWYIRDVGVGLANLSRSNVGSRPYEEDDAMSAWEGWQARAALERKPS